MTCSWNPRRAALDVVLALGCAVPAFAQTKFWTGAALDGNWNNGNNWIRPDDGRTRRIEISWRDQ